MAKLRWTSQWTPDLKRQLFCSEKVSRRDSGPNRSESKKDRLLPVSLLSSNPSAVKHFWLCLPGSFLNWIILVIITPMLTPEQIENKLDRILLKVQKPGRYVGGELNIVVKDWDNTRTKVAFIFPDIYDIGV